MNSNNIEIYSSCSKDRNKSASPCISNLSPITNLTVNLSGLSTSVTGTPLRRITCSNKTSKERTFRNYPQDLACNDSPTFQEIFPRRKSFKHRGINSVSRSLPTDSEEEKENIFPVDNIFHRLSEKYEENIPCSSQDSGYSGISENIGSGSPASPLFTASKISFSDYEDEEDKHIFQLEEVDGFYDLSPAPVCMSNLLTKPLTNSNSPKHLTNSRYGKPPIRRCLSLEMDSESESSSTESNLKVETFVAPFKIRRKIKVTDNMPTKSIFKRPEPPIQNLMSYSKRRKSSPSIQDVSDGNFVFRRSYSETSATIMHAVLKADLQPELIGDGSRSYALPLCKGRHQDLKCISPETLVGLLKGEYKNHIENYILVDCRYPYEFEGGHIQGAKNIFTKEDLISAFFDNYTYNNQRNAVIFHCEFSSERAPTLCRFLRKKDREINEDLYPRLHHPEMYILEGGYKAFFESYQEYCEPQTYKPMNHKDHGFELRHFRAKSKSWSADCKGRSKLRSNSKPYLL